MISEGPSDALVLDAPGGTLRKLFRVAPQMHSPANQVWRDPLTRLYWDIAEVIYRLSPFAVAGWGEEAGAITATEDNLTLKDLERGGYLISSQLRSRLGPGRQGTPLSSGLILMEEALTQ
ncbi:hypothetical protein IV102_28905 [bacterium]|nr:hypothetical protein [bacterium]